MRGKELSNRVKYVTARITPAYAGKSWRDFAARFVYQDHPRVCGEKLAVFVLCDLTVGSPPRMRGKVLQKRDVLVRIGITPAYAGKSLPR